MESNELRNSFLKFFKKYNHKIVESSPVIPYDDPTLMFTNAGMNQFKEVLLGNEIRSYKRAASVQKCIRVSGKHNDFEIVGFDGYHHTFFEMLGNWSFGDYYKEEAIKFAWEYLTEVLNFPSDRLGVSVYKDDNEAYDIWKNLIKIPENRILKLGDIDKGDEENFWSMGDTGPSGPCTEIYYKAYNNCEVEFTSKGYSNDFIELWNLVFMEFYRHSNGKLSPLKFKSVDTGMGFERLYAIIKNKESNYHTDLFMPIIKHIEKLINKKYNRENEVSFQVIADHIRALTFAIGDGGTFSNEGRGYVLRKILRRAARHFKKLGATKPLLFFLVDDVVNIMGDFYYDLKEKKEQIKEFIKIEEEKFLNTLEIGLNHLTVIIDKLKKENKNTISGRDIFVLYDTYGFPVDITKEIAHEYKIEIDEAGYNDLMEQQRERGKQSWAGSKNVLNQETIVNLIKDKRATEFKGYDVFNTKSRILTIILNNNTINRLETGEEAGILLDITPFYAEMGGQIGDTGTIRNNQNEFLVKDTQKYGNYIIHWGNLKRGYLEINNVVYAEVDFGKRFATMQNHTGTHLLQAALRKVVGTHITQAGSYVGPDRLRFDFRHYSSLTDEEIIEIEKIVNEIIQRNYRVEKFIEEKERAIKMGAMAIFGEKYGEKVRVVKVNDFSIELCGGTHLEYTGEIGFFIITSESSIAAGIRRIEALTGMNAVRYFHRIRKNIKEVATTLKVKESNISERLKQIIENNKELEKQLKKARQTSAKDVVKEILNKSEKINNSYLIVHLFENEDIKFLSALGDRIKNKVKSGVIFFINKTNERVNMLLILSNDIVAKGNDASKLIKELAEVVKGSGGGRKDRAQAGGRDINKLNELIKFSKQKLQKIL